MSAPHEGEQREAVVLETLAWEGTPYHPHGRVKGVGVDCAMLPAEVYERCRLVPHTDYGFYPQDWHLHRGEELFEQWLEKVGARRVQTPAIADIGVWRFGRTYSHGSIVIGLDVDGELLLMHSYIGRQVERIRGTEAPLAGRDVHWWSLWA